jgi:hypothetical protein
MNMKRPAIVQFTNSFNVLLLQMYDAIYVLGLVNSATFQLCLYKAVHLFVPLVFILLWVACHRSYGVQNAYFARFLKNTNTIQNITNNGSP